MNILSISSYKEKRAAEFFFGRAVVNLPAAPLSVARTRYEGTEKSKAHCVAPGEVGRWVSSHDGIESDAGFVVVIAGPGDPLATPEQTIDIMKGIKADYPKAEFALRSFGFGGSAYAEDLADAGVRYVELVTDGMDVASLEDLYLWIRPARKTLPLRHAAPMLFQEQQLAIDAFKQKGILVCGGVTLYENSSVEGVVRLAGELKGVGVELVSLYLPDGSACLGGVPYEVKKGVEEMVPVVDSLLTHCCATGAGAKAAGEVDSLPKPSSERPNVAVVSSNGMEIDLHLGHAIKILIYGPRGDGLPCLLEARDAPEPGGGKARWSAMADLLSDCFVLLVASAGESPRRVLGERGIRVMVVQDNVEGCVDVLYGGGKKKGQKG